jgi:FkbM family methyltransferase
MRLRLKHKIRHLVQKRLGLDIVPYPLYNAAARTVRLINHYDVDCVVDVGANDGGFASSIRDAGYTGRIISFEPLPKPFAALRRVATVDQNWDVYQQAIGATKGSVAMNVSANAGQSSSVLPMLESHLSAAPYSRYIDSETVNQDRLDSLLPELGVSAGDRTFIKIDVQGYEAAVLDGAADLLTGTSIVGLQLELSLIPLYEGAMTYREGIDRAEALGMSLMGLSPVFADPATGRLLQADAVFFRA